WRVQIFRPLVASRQKSSPPPSPTTTEPAIVGRTSTACAKVHGCPPASATPTTLSLFPATPTATSAPMAGLAEPIFAMTAEMDAPLSSLQFVENKFGCVCPPPQATSTIAARRILDFMIRLPSPAPLDRAPA